MKIIKSLVELAEIYSEEKIQITIGNFDGVHVGHREFLSRISDDCKKSKSKFVVVTFVPHPHCILKASAGFLINTYEERRELLETCHVDYLLEIDFTRDFSTLTPEEFLNKFIFNFSGVDKIYLGHDFAFGANKKGDYLLMKKFCEGKNVALVLQDEYKKEDIAISSTHARKSIQDGNVKLTRVLLGRNYFVSGRVIKGEGRGRQIGFPTANLDYSKDLIVPAKGVYLTKTSIGNMVYNSVTNIGSNPTFNSDNSIHVETHIIDFVRDIYGEEIRITFEDKIRDEKKFSSVNELIDQIAKDVELAKTRKQQ